jgi:uncharacterized protein YbjT (DUF2867 family)
MNIILGGTGRVGSAVAKALLKRGKAVTIVTRNARHASASKLEGARIIEVDIRDVSGLHDLFCSGRRAFLLSPPADPATDTDVEERSNVAAIIQALKGSGLEKVVAASTYGAMPGERCGDLTVLHEFEEQLRAQPIPAAINRGAYYMSNWDGMLEAVREHGTLQSFVPADLSIPMVAPSDVGEAAAQRLIDPEEDVELRYVEGPKRYTPQDVADAFAQALGTNVRVEAVVPTAWEETFIRLGFSESAAKSYACMTRTVVNETAKPENPVCGSTTLQDHVRSLVERTSS